MQIDQRRYTNAWCADLHACADDRIQHPRRDDDHYTGRRLNVGNWTGGALLGATELDMASMQRMPTVMNLDFLPDMGRMTGQSYWAGATICSRDRMSVASARLISTA